MSALSILQVVVQMSVFWVCICRLRYLAITDVDRRPAAYFALIGIGSGVGSLCNVGAWAFVRTGSWSFEVEWMLVAGALAPSAGVLLALMLSAKRWIGGPPKGIAK